MSEKKLSSVASIKSLTEERDKEILAKLEQFQEMAKEGHLSDIIIIGKVRGVPITELLWESDNSVELVGALEIAKQEIIQSYLDEIETEEDVHE